MSKRKAPEPSDALRDTNKVADDINQLEQFAEAARSICPPSCRPPRWPEKKWIADGEVRCPNCGGKAELDVDVTFSVEPISARGGHVDLALDYVLGKGLARWVTAARLSCRHCRAEVAIDRDDQ